jgi:uncharacterized protein (DUF4415 family)
LIRPREGKSGSAGRRPGFAQIDVRDRDALRKLFSAHRFDADVQAALKASGKGWQTRVNNAYATG